MSDYSELKRVAEELIAANDLFFNESPQCNEVGDAWSLADDRFTEAASPEVILALIAENERLKNRLEVDPRHDYDGISTRDATVKVLDEQVDQLKAENEQLKAENERLSTENSEIESAAITYIEDMQEAQRENARLTELFTVGMTLDGNLRVYGDWQSVRKAQEILAERDQLRAEVAGLRTGYEAYEQVNAELKAEVEGLRKLGPSKEIIWCACGDGYPVNSYGAGFMDANNGVCANCDAALGQGVKP